MTVLFADRTERDPDSMSSLRCVGCGYDLRRSRADGSCPECGVVVLRSIEAGRQSRSKGFTRRTLLAAAVLPLAGAAVLAIGATDRTGDRIADLVMFGGCVLSIVLALPSAASDPDRSASADRALARTIVLLAGFLGACFAAGAAVGA